MSHPLVTYGAPHFTARAVINFQTKKMKGTIILAALTSFLFAFSFFLMEEMAHAINTKSQKIEPRPNSKKNEIRSLCARP